jgi:hypothetical protein
MSLCVIERLLNKVATAAGFINQEKPDRWENGEAIRELEESRDKTLKSQSNASQVRGKQTEEQLGEIQYWNKHPVYHLYRLPNRWTWLKWEHVRKVIHKCNATGETIFDEDVTKENQNDSQFWERRCVAAGGITPIFLYDKPKDDEYWVKTRLKIQSQKEEKLLKINFPNICTATTNKKEAEIDLRNSFISAGTRTSTLELIKFTMKGKTLVVEASGPKEALKEIEDKVSEAKIAGLSPSIEEEIQPFDTTFGPENQDIHCKPNIMIRQVYPKRADKTVSYEADENGRMHMNEPFPEAPRHPSMLSVLTFKKVEIEDFDDNRKADEKFMERNREVLHRESVPLIEEPGASIRWQKQGQPYRHHVVKAGFSTILAPRGYADVKLGVSILAPAGTFAVIAPDEDGYQNAWELGDHRIDTDKNGEAMVRIINRTDQRLVLPTDTTIGKIHIIRTRVNVNKSVTPKAHNKALMKIMLPKHPENRKNKANHSWDREIRSEEEWDQEREKSAAVQTTILGESQRTRSLHICDNDNKGRKSYASVEGRTVSIRGARKFIRKSDNITMMDWVDPSIIMPKWTFIIPHSAICATAGDLWLLRKKRLENASIRDENGFPCAIRRTSSLHNETRILQRGVIHSEHLQNR